MGQHLTEMVGCCTQFLRPPVITKEGASQTNPPALSDPGQSTAYDMILPLAVLNALPTEKKITLTTTVDGITTVEQWWMLDNLPGEDGSPIRETLIYSSDPGHSTTALRLR